MTVKEHPILFTGEMVRAILPGQKSQTRRVVKPQPDEPVRWDGCQDDMDELCETHWWEALDPAENPTEHYTSFECPFGKVGDRLWVRETWLEDRPLGLPENVCGQLHYKANGYTHQIIVDSWAGQWKPSIHMPRWASRITLEVTNIRVERLQDISENDALAEGVTLNDENDYVAPGLPGRSFQNPRMAFWQMWDHIAQKSKYFDDGWRDNPWVWAISFKKLEESGKTE